MSKKKIIIFIIIFILLVILGIFCYKNDSIRFKISYEYINSMEYNNGKTIKVNIPFDNRVKYLDSNKEILDFLNNDTGVLYFGYNTCPWCRNGIPVLIDVIKKENINLYYVDIHKINLSKEVYQFIDQCLSLNGEGEKGLAVPNVIAVKDGKIVGNHIGTVSSFHNPYNKMTEEEKKELTDIYLNLIKEIK